MCCSSAAVGVHMAGCVATVECQNREDNVCSSEGCQESELLESWGEATPHPTRRATNCRDEMSLEAVAREAVRAARASKPTPLRD